MTTARSAPSPHRPPLALRSLRSREVPRVPPRRRPPAASQAPSPADEESDWGLENSRTRRVVRPIFPEASTPETSTVVALPGRETTGEAAAVPARAAIDFAEALRSVHGVDMPAETAAAVEPPLPTPPSFVERLQSWAALELWRWARPGGGLAPRQTILRLWHVAMCCLPFVGATTLYAAARLSMRTAEDFKNMPSEVQLAPSAAKPVRLPVQAIKNPDVVAVQLPAAVLLPEVIIDVVAGTKPRAPRLAKARANAKASKAAPWYSAASGKTAAVENRQPVEKSKAAAMSSPASANLPQTPSRRQVMAAVATVRGKLQACAPQHAGMMLPVRLTVASSGAVSAALVAGRLAGSKEATCIGGALKSARFPAFKQDKFVVDYPILL